MSDNQQPSAAQAQALQLLLGMIAQQQSTQSDNSLMERFGAPISDEQMSDLAAMLSRDGGPPPAAPSAIDDLDEVTISSSNRALLQKECGVCAETFRIGDHAKKLPCKIEKYSIGSIPMTVCIRGY
ncbi:RING/U-box domain-containing protein [Planoprotostelium fungivorum]|uniref:RING/U-box domain-containing protein n=1 Tax=Planoprotostelium fungivorum TaxID=1890364 RepID=A0A2P6NPW3_9EUKA|nr:RING/U-box domain-containing protein [Planoprotostelium fungivorum]